MSSVMEAGPCVRTNQLDFDDEVIYKATQYLYDHARHRNEQPFCLTVSMTHPHDPYAMTQDYWDMYEDVDIPLPTTSALPADKHDPHSRRVMKCVDLADKDIPEERIKAARRAYFSACTYVDTQIGNLLKTLKNCGLDDNTIVVFTGDHGDMLGERGLWYKMTWYEMSARVPMVVYAPGKYQPKRVKENVSTMDLLPTFVAMSGGAIEPDLPIDGVSLMPYLDDNVSGNKTDTVVGEYMGEGTLAPVVMIRRGPWKFIYSPIDPPMLFNVQEDPHETNNLVAGIELPIQTVASIKNKAIAGGPTGLPTPVISPQPHKSQAAFFGSANATDHLPTPPRSPGLGKGSSNGTTTPDSTAKNDPKTLLASFIAEAYERWDFDLIRKQVLNSQRRRRLVYSALMKGRVTTWDYSPVVEGHSVYVRNYGNDALGDFEYTSRWPRAVAVNPNSVDAARAVQYRP